MSHISLSALAGEIKNFSRVLVSAHVAPDPDAVGSSAALALGLQQCGIAAVGYLADPVPDRIKPLLHPFTYISEPPTEHFDALIVVDTASRRRVGPQIDQLATLVDRVVNIDHHASNDGWGDINSIEPTSASSAELVFSLLKEMKVNFSQAMLNLLLSGLMDDTGSFRFSNTNARALQAAAEMVELGAQPELVSGVLYHSVPERVLRLKSLALSTLEFPLQHKLSLLVVTQEMLAKAGAKSEDTDGLIDEARSVEGIRAAVLIRELPDGWKLSLRSKDGSVDVNEIAAVFGGGGHRAAAGCRIVGKLAEVKQRIVREFESRL